MAISVTWPTRVINVPKADMALVQSTPIEVRELDLNTFRLTLKNLEDDEEGMPYLRTHNHNTAVSVGGITLARVVEIINDYTVTFEDGAYVVNLIGANSNVADRVNPNNVSIRSANSAGLIQTREIERAAFKDGVTIDVLLGVSGTLYPIGTDTNPVDNLADALQIAATRGLENLYVQGDLSIQSGEVISDFNVFGKGATLNVVKTRITFVSGCIANNTQYQDLRVEGVMGGETRYLDCVIGSISNAHCRYERCAMIGPLVSPTSIGSTHTKYFENCYSSYTEFVFDHNTSQLKTIWDEFTGLIKFQNCTHAGAITRIHMTGGRVTIDASCTAGTYVITGDCIVVNNSTATVDTAGVASAATWTDPKALTVGKFLGLK